MPDFRLPPLDVGARVYRGLLRLYPPRFRRAFALDLVETFRDQRREMRRAGTPAGAFWLAMVQDVVVHAFAEWTWTFLHTGRSKTSSDEEESPMLAVPYALRAGEVRFAARRLVRVPGFTIATVGVLALGIGATTAVFSIVNGVLLEPLPFPHAERLVALKHTLQVSGVEELGQSDGTLVLYQARARAFDGIAAWHFIDVNLAPASAGDRAERVNAAATTANFFDVLDVHPLIGRPFRAGEDRVGSAPVVVLSYALWRRRFRGAPAVIGQRFVVDGVSREIVGVMPRAFRFLSSTGELWLPMALDRAHPTVGSFNADAVGRLKPGVTIDAGRADLARVLPQIFDEFTVDIPRDMWNRAHIEPKVLALRDSVVGGVSRLLWILLASMALVLVIACANVANLFLVRGEGRQLELALRGALGSGLAGMLAQTLSEALLIAAASGAIGLALATLGVRLASGVGDALALPRLEDVSVDGRVVLFVLGVSAVCAAFVSVIPVLRARRLPVTIVLRGGGRGTTAGGPRHRARSVLVIAQTSLALVLVATSGLLGRSFARLERVDPGFDATGVVVARLTLPEASYRTMASRVQLYDALVEKVRALPGTRDATLTTYVPLSADHDDGVVTIEDHPPPPNGVPDDHFQAHVDGHYFSTLHIPLLRGRSFGAQDASRSSLEAIVSHAFAKRYWGDASPLGKRIRPGILGPWYTIVGEVGDVHYDALDRLPNDIAYFPVVEAAQHPGPTFVAPYFTLLAHSSVPAEVMTAAIRDIVHSLDPSLPTFGEQRLSTLVRAASARARQMLVLLALASTLALVLGAVGIYGVMAYGVSLREREIGVRIALGAQPAQVRWMISRNGVGLAAIGVAFGVACALGVTRFLQSLLYDVSPTDPAVLAGTCAVLLLVAMLASWVPARRAASVDPAEALRGA